MRLTAFMFAALFLFVPQNAEAKKKCTHSKQCKTHEWCLDSMCQEKPSWNKKKRGTFCKKTKECKNGLLCVDQKCTVFTERKKGTESPCVGTRRRYLEQFLKACKKNKGKAHREDYARIACVAFAKRRCCSPNTCKRIKCPSTKMSKK